MKKRKAITHQLRDNWIKNWLRENERSPHYISFIKTQDLKSLGAKSRTPDYERPGQDRNMLSTNERIFFIRLLFDSQITWIKEQYPLLPIERPMAIAKQLGVKYPTYPYTANVPIVMTSDFYCGTILGKEVVYSIKDEKSLIGLTPQKLANLDAKQQIERIFWKTAHVNWRLILSSSIKTTFNNNLEQLAPYIKIREELAFLLPLWLDCLSRFVSKKPLSSMSDAFICTAQLMSLTYEDVIELFQHSLWHKYITADLSQRLHYEKTIEVLDVKVSSYD